MSSLGELAKAGSISIVAPAGELVAYGTTLVVMCALDCGITAGLMAFSLSALWAKIWSNAVGFLGNFLLRRFFVFGGAPSAKSF